jgi:uncharacterized membrane protein
VTDARSHHETLGVERMLFFSDAVMAIAMTLLVIELKIPELGPSAESRDLATALLAQTPRFVAFILSFFIIGEAWTEHHRVGGLLRGFDYGLLWWNLLLLFFVVLMPFVTGLVSEGDRWLSVVLYASVFGGLGFAKLGFWFHATRRGLVERTVGRAGRSISFGLWATPTVALLVAASALAGLRQTMWGFFLIPVVAYVLDRLSRLGTPR